eukprot:7554892-Pyramimonas_sp.AAC.1
MDLPVCSCVGRPELGVHMCLAESMASYLLRSFHRRRVAMHRVGRHLRGLCLPSARRTPLWLPAAFQEAEFRKWRGSAIACVARAI